MYRAFILIVVFCSSFMFYQHLQYLRFVQNNQIPKNVFKTTTPLLKFKTEVDWVNYADYNFNIDESTLPKTKSIIFQVIITNQVDHWAGKNIDDSKVERMTEALCKSAKAWNEGLITLHTSNSAFEFCNNWENSLVVKFEAKMVKYVSLHDERLFVVEQFIKKYKLHERYENIMLSDSDVYILRKDPWNYFNKECPNSRYWMTFWDDSCEELYYDPFTATSSQIKDCYGEDVLQQMMDDKMKNLNYPIAGRSNYFLKMLQDANDARLTAMTRLGDASPRTVCDMASIFYVAWKNKLVRDTCLHGLRFSDYEGPFSHKTDAGGYRPDQENIIVPTSRGEKFNDFSFNFYSYERKYSSLCYFSNIASKILKKEGKIEIRDTELHKLAEISEQRFPDIYLFDQKFSLNSPAEPVKYIHTEFDFTDLDLLPKTRDVVFQVLIFDDLYYTGTKYKIQDFTDGRVPPLCSSCEKFGYPLITLYHSSVAPSSCSSWNNSIAISFKNKLRPHMSVHDARFVILEQFIRQYKLFYKYERMMFAEPDVHLLREGGLKEVEKSCAEQSLWVTTLDGQCSLMEKNPDHQLRNKIRKCFGIETLRQLEQDKMKSLYFPFASTSREFLHVLWKMNMERIFLRDFIFKHDSAFYQCDEALLNVAVWKLKKEKSVCEKALKVADHEAVFTKTTSMPGVTIDFEKQIQAIMNNQNVPKLSSLQKQEYREINNMCSDIGRIKQRNKDEEEDESKRNSVRIGHVVRITHKKTGLRLCSDEVKYKTGSKNQLIKTFYVHELLQEYGFGLRNARGQYDDTILRDGLPISIRHGYTGQFLHVYPGFKSPVSGQQEVSAIWIDDLNVAQPQRWIVKVPGGGELKYYQDFMLVHEETGCYLHSHNEPFQGGNEVTCYSYQQNDVNNIWLFIQGYKPKEYY